MLKKHFIDIIIFLAAMGLLGAYLVNKYGSPKKAPIKPITLVRANDILRKKSTIPEKMINTSVSSSACTFYLKHASELSMMDFANEFLDKTSDEIIQNCVGAFPGPLQSKWKKAHELCDSSKRDDIKKECFTALVETKTSVVSSIIKPEVNYRELDSSVLIHLMADKFFSGEIFDHPLKSLALVNALLEKEPGYLGGLKVKLILLGMSTLRNEERYEDLFFETMDEAHRLSPKDKDLVELDLIQRADVISESQEKKDNSEFIEFLEDEENKHPNEWIYDYYRAYAIYQNGKGDFDSALEILQQALKKSPQNARLLDTIEKLKSDDIQIKQRPFTLTISFSLDDL